MTDKSAGEALDILAFAAHPDDAELGCAGALLLGVAQGLRVGVADLSDGEKASRGNPTLRQEEIQAANAILKVQVRVSLGLPDTEIGQKSAHRLAVIETIRRYRPRIVLAPFWRDRHPDHAATGRLVKAAAFYAGVASVGQGTPHRPEQVFYYMLHQPFKPSFILDISSVWAQKTAAILAFGSQFTATKSEEGPATALTQPSFWRFIEARAIYYGGLVGAAYGEPYYSEGPIGLTRLPGLEQQALAPGQSPVYKPYL